MDSEAQFLFVTCQVGAEPAVKAEFARRWPDFRFAYSRPGFLTFKLPPPYRVPDDFDPQSVFARTSGMSLGKVTGDNEDDLANAAWKLAEGQSFSRLHVWQRDLRAPGDHDYEPGPSEAGDAVRVALVRNAPASCAEMTTAPPLAQPGELVLDCVLVDPGQWWIGYHRARTGPSCRAGGFYEVAPPADMVSRAYLKMAEALEWSQLPVTAGQHAVELGCAPGGSCQVLLARGLQVVGIDPAVMHATLLAHPGFTHVRKRASDVRRREFRKTRLLAADMNVTPETTLEAVQEIVTHEDVHIEGLLLTLKLHDWQLADVVPEYLEQVRSWGYPQVMARQLQYGRQEICVAAQRPARRRTRGGARGGRRAARSGRRGPRGE
ncbi:MAG TPA: SAM-dependent methyltransferase [Pirellulales bacterium]|jgi:23S rRNA (cytidine2498-2'-O)-methyltransferase